MLCTTSMPLAAECFGESSDPAAVSEIPWMIVWMT